MERNQHLAGSRAPDTTLVCSMCACVCRFYWPIVTGFVNVHCATRVKSFLNLNLLIHLSVTEMQEIVTFPWL